MSRNAVVLRWSCLLLLIPTCLSPLMAAEKGQALYPAAGGPTITASLVCFPVSGTLPFSTHFSSTVYNQTAGPRRFYAQVDVATAGGLYLTGISAGVMELPAGVGEFVQRGWNKNIPYNPIYVGVNEYLIRVTDITRPPFNQPPYAPAGDTSLDACQIEGTIR